MKRILLFFSLLAIALASGCIGQAGLGTGGIDVRVLADPPAIRTDEGTTLIVDVENKDTSQFIKVFVEAFDTGPFVATRSLAVPPQQGELPVPGTYRVEQGRTNYDVTVFGSCTSSTQCFDEEYAGCGVCAFFAGSAEGTCQPSRRAKVAGEACDKPCECGPGLVCRRGQDGTGMCMSAEATCTDGTSLNTCGQSPLFCSPYGGDVREACGGFDAIPSSAFVYPQGGPASFSDDCGCPLDTVCKGDGSCGQQSGCFTTIYGMKPGDIRTLECDLVLRNPGSIIRDATANIQLRTVFRKRLQLDEVLQFLSLEELRRQERIGELQRKPREMVAGDQNVQVLVSYSKPPPFVEGETVLMQLAIRSTGAGRIYTINPSDIVIGQPGDRIKCSLETPLLSDRGVFPPITCEIDSKEVATLENYPITINVYYDYEVRQNLPITIQKV